MKKLIIFCNICFLISCTQKNYSITQAPLSSSETSISSSHFEYSSSILENAYSSSATSLNISSSSIEISSSAFVSSSTKLNEVIISGKSYKTKTIGSQTWMAENMNAITQSSLCYANMPSNCDIYGRLYTWDDALTLCPSGWHLPTKSDWLTLRDYVGGNLIAGSKLKALVGWNEYVGVSSTDAYGFGAIAAGIYNNVYFERLGDYTIWWSSEQYDQLNGYSYDMFYYNNALGNGWDLKTNGFSVRCIEN